jgi:hypothetical protein
MRTETPQKIGESILKILWGSRHLKNARELRIKLRLARGTDLFNPIVTEKHFTELQSKSQEYTLRGPEIVESGFEYVTTFEGKILQR